MKSSISPARGLSFVPVEIATEVVASLGNRGGGKSNGAAVIAELLLGAGVPVIVLDYVGIWFSLRLNPDGRTASPYQIPVLGGRHGDIGLVASTGAVVAEALARTQSSAVLDISAFSKMDRCRFATDFAEAFFRSKKEHPGPVQLLLEEAQRFVPQKLFTGQERMLGAFEEIGEVGRNYGIGLHLISQRPQKINKDVLNLADTVFGYRTNGVLERKAIAEWVQEKGAEGRTDVQNELPGLERGSAIVWSPSRKIFGQFAISKKTTYDAGATPIAARAAVKTRPLDLNSLETAMGKAAEEAKANDPRALRARVADLERQLARPAAPAADPQLQRRVAAAEDLVRGQKAQLDAAQRQFEEIAEMLSGARDRAFAAVSAAKGRPAHVPAPLAAPPALPARRAPQAVAPRMARADGHHAMTKGARAVLTALAQNPAGLTRRKLGILAGYAPGGTSMREALALGRKAAWVDDLVDGTIKITDIGLGDLGPYDPLPTGAALREHWFRELPTGACRILRAICAAYPEGLTKQDIADATERDGGTPYAPGGTSMREALAMLRGLELVDDVGDRVLAGDALF